jgi:hypothetical protein
MLGGVRETRTNVGSRLPGTPFDVELNLTQQYMDPQDALISATEYNGPLAPAKLQKKELPILQSHEKKISEKKTPENETPIQTVLSKNPSVATVFNETIPNPLFDEGSADESQINIEQPPNVQEYSKNPFFERGLPKQGETIQMEGEPEAEQEQSVQETSFPTHSPDNPVAFSEVELIPENPNANPVADTSEFDPLLQDISSSNGIIDREFSSDFFNTDTNVEIDEIIAAIERDSDEFDRLEDEYSANISILNKQEQEKMLREIAEKLEINDPTSEKIETELKKPEKRGMFARISQSVKNIMRKIGLVKDKKKPIAIKSSIEEYLEGDKFKELNARLMEILNDRDEITDYIYDSIIENGKTTSEIFQELTKTSQELRENQELYEQLNDLRNDFLKQTVEYIESTNQTELGEIKSELEELKTKLGTLSSSVKDKMEELSMIEPPVVLETISTGISGEELKNIVNVLLSKRLNELKTAVPDVKTQNEIEILSQRVKNLMLENVMLKELKEDSMKESPDMMPSQTIPQQSQTIPQQPQTIPQQPQTIPQQQQQTIQQPQIKPDVQSEQVISISPEQLLDNKTIVIKIMMPRSAQIDTTSKTGDTSEGFITSLVNNDTEAKQGAEQTINDQQKKELPPPYSEHAGGKKKKQINPAIVHPASLFK